MPKRFARRLQREKEGVNVAYLRRRIPQRILPSQTLTARTLSSAEVKIILIKSPHSSSMPFGIRIALGIHGERPHENTGAPRLSSTHATITKRRHGGTILFYPSQFVASFCSSGTDVQTTTPAPLSPFSVQPQLPLSLAGDPLYSFLPVLSLARLRA